MIRVDIVPVKGAALFDVVIWRKGCDSGQFAGRGLPRDAAEGLQRMIFDRTREERKPADYAMLRRAFGKVGE